MGIFEAFRSSTLREGIQEETKISYRGGEIFHSARGSDQKSCIHKRNLTAISYSAEAMIIRIVAPFIRLTKRKFCTLLLIIVLSLKGKFCCEFSLSTTLFSFLLWMRGYFLVTAYYYSVFIMRESMSGVGIFSSTSIHQTSGLSIHPLACIKPFMKQHFEIP